MTTEEIVKTLRTAQAEVEWNYPMDYAAAIDEAIEAVYVRDELIKKNGSHDLRIGVKAALTMILEKAKDRAKMEGIKEE